MIQLTQSQLFDGSFYPCVVLYDQCYFPFTLPMTQPLCSYLGDRGLGITVYSAYMLPRDIEWDQKMATNAGIVYISFDLVAKDST
jgi:hypothetical protein